jgi:hypothetical protein
MEKKEEGRKDEERSGKDNCQQTVSGKPTVNA